MIARTLARFTDTPKHQPGMKAFDVFYRTLEGDRHTAIITRDKEKIGQQIAQVLFANHPDATDYTFREFDYLTFQARTFVSSAIENNLLQMSTGQNFIDEAELAR